MDTHHPGLVNRESEQALASAIPQRLDAHLSGPRRSNPSLQPCTQELGRAGPRPSLQVLTTQNVQSLLQCLDLLLAALHALLVGRPGVDAGWPQLLVISHRVA